MQSYARNGIHNSVKRRMPEIQTTQPHSHIFCMKCSNEYTNNSRLTTLRERARETELKKRSYYVSVVTFSCDSVVVLYTRRIVIKKTKDCQRYRTPQFQNKTFVSFKTVQLRILCVYFLTLKAKVNIFV